MTTYDAYMVYLYGIPWSFFVVLLIHFGLLSNYRATYFIVDIVLGIHRIEASDIPNFPTTTKQQQSEETNSTKTTYYTRSMSKTECYCNTFTNFLNDHHEYVSVYLHIERDEKIKFNRYLRLLSCMFTSAILTILLTFIYESCILSNVTIKIGDWCPDHEAECFDSKSRTLVFNCTPYQKVNFNTNSSYVSCFGWVYDLITFRQVIDAVGVCGGLLRIISCIVPWIYHLSYYENAPWKAFFWIWVPLLPAGALFTIGGVGQTLKWAPPSILTIYSLTFLTCLTGGAWYCAYDSAKKRKQKRNVSPKIDADQSTTPPQVVIQIPD